MGSDMTQQEREAEAKAVADLEQKIVKVKYAYNIPHHRQAKNIDTNKILSLAKKIRETYDHSDTALDGAH